MKIALITIVVFVIFQPLAYSNGVNCTDVEVKLHIVNRYSKSPRYELDFYRCGEKIAERVYYKGKTILSKGKIPDGRVIERYDDGSIKNIFFYKNGKRNGKALSFYKSGKLKAEGVYKNDNPVGIGRVYYESGKIKAEWKILNGKEVYHREYNENGVPKEETYHEGDNEANKEDKNTNPE